MRSILIGLFVVAVAHPALAQTTVSCDGTESGGTGMNSCGLPPLPYAYPVVPGPAGMTDLYIGTDDSNLANYTNLCMPPGWTLVLDATRPAHDTQKTPHGLITGTNGLCPSTLHFSGPVLTTAFTFGFDHPATGLAGQPSSHDVDWWTSDGTAAIFALPVGLGQGPVHSPIKTRGAPTLSTQGAILLTVLLLAATSLVMWRRRRAGSHLSAGRGKY